MTRMEIEWNRVEKVGPTILIRIKAAAWRFSQLDYCVLPREAVYGSFTVPREIPRAFYTPQQTNSPSSRKSALQRASKFPHPPPLQRRWQIFSISPPYALCKIFHP